LIDSVFFLLWTYALHFCLELRYILYQNWTISNYKPRVFFGQMVPENPSSISDRNNS
jgi:hypothetical protein